VYSHAKSKHQSQNRHRSIDSHFFSFSFAPATEIKRVQTNAPFTEVPPSTLQKNTISRTQEDASSDDLLNWKLTVFVETVAVATLNIVVLLVTKLCFKGELP